MPSAVPTKTYRTTAVIVGLLFLSSTVTFALGNSLVRAALLTQPVDTAGLLLGVLSQAYTAVAVAGIGVAMVPVLEPRAPRAARGYLILRSLECVTILAVGTSMVTTRHLIDHYELPIYAVSGVAGIVLCGALATTRLVPLALARLGMVGYPVLLLGALAAALHLTDLNTPAGMLFFLPGALFEIALPVLLITRGFTPTVSLSPSRTAPITE